MMKNIILIFSILFSISYCTEINAAYVDLTSAAEKSVESVVHVRTKVNIEFHKRRMDPFQFFFGSPLGRDGIQRESIDHSSGSGVIISKEGYIITNYHVVKGADVVEVVLHDKRKFTAKIMGSDPRTDVALLKIEAKNLQFCEYGDSEKIKLGEWVLAVGYPYTLSSTVTAGIVSAKARNLDGNRISLNSFIQTDAAVNPGNSGGALVNQKGELIGMNTMIYSPTGSYSGYSFAVPVNVIKRIVSDIIQYKEVQRAYLGIVPVDIDADLSKQYNLPLNGVLIYQVTPNSGADDAGLKRGDVIQEIESKKINSSARLVEMISSLKPGRRVNVLVVRDGVKMNFNVLLKK